MSRCRAAFGLPVLVVAVAVSLAFAGSEGSSAQSFEYSWQQLSPAEAGRFGHTAVYDSRSDQMVVVGGNLRSGAGGDALSIDIQALDLAGTGGWTAVADTTSREPRQDHAAIFGPEYQRRVVVFGGRTYDDVQLGDLLSYELTQTGSYTGHNPPIPLGNRYGHTAVYDPLAERMVVFGGMWRPDPYPVWYYHDAVTMIRWMTPEGSDLYVSGPTARANHVAVYDSRENRMIVHGGSDNDEVFGDSWALDLREGHERWELLSEQGPYRTSHAGIYDPVGHRLIIYGGRISSQERGDVLALDLSDLTWSQIRTRGSTPDPRQEHTAIYDAANHRMVVFGGLRRQEALSGAYALPLAGEAVASPTHTATRPPGCPPDDAGDVQSEAADFPWAGGGGLSCWLCPSGDVDYWRFRVYSPQVVTVRMYALPENYDLIWLDERQNEVGRSINPGTTDESIEATIEPGLYYLRVRAADDRAWSTEPYFLQVVMTDPTPTPSFTPTATPTRTRVPTRTPTVTLTPSRTPTITPTPRPELVFKASFGADPPYETCYGEMYRQTLFFAPMWVDARDVHVTMQLPRQVRFVQEDSYYRWCDYPGAPRGTLDESTNTMTWDWDTVSHECAVHLAVQVEVPDVIASEPNYLTASGSIESSNAWDENFTYSLEMCGPDCPDLEFHIDDALPATYVSKIIPESDTPTGARQYVDFVGDIWGTTDFHDDIEVTLTLPNDERFTNITFARFRDYIHEEGDLIPYDHPIGSSEYRVRVSLSYIKDGRYWGQVVFRFQVYPGAPVGPVDPKPVMRVYRQGSTAWCREATVDLYLEDRVEALVITHRPRLYRIYDVDEVADLLHEVHRQVDSYTGDVASGSVFYVDRYDPRIHRWDNFTVDNSSWDTANEVADSIDGLLPIWRTDGSATILLDDGGTYTRSPEYLLIVGDDDVVPYTRVADHTDAERDWLDGGMTYNSVLDSLFEHNRYFTDNKHAAAEVGGGHSYWEHGYLRLATGRLVGATARDMRRLAERGAAGPRQSEYRMVAALADVGVDMSGKWSVWNAIREWGYDIRNEFEQPQTVLRYGEPYVYQPFGWGPSDLYALMSAGYGAFYYAGHGTPYTLTDLDVNTLGLTSANVSAADKPFVLVDACGAGYTYDHGGSSRTVPRFFTDNGASGYVGPAGVSWYWLFVDASHFAEKLIQLFWMEAIGEGWSQPVGEALIKAKSRYDPGIMWWDKDEKTVRQFNLVGLPWMHLPEFGTGADSFASANSLSSDTLAAPDSDAEFGPPSKVAQSSRARTPRGGALGEDEVAAEITGLEEVIDTAASGSLEISTTLRFDDYTVGGTDTGDFDLLRIQGLSLYTEIGAPMVPYASLSVRLPTGAEVVTVTAAVKDPVTISDINLPTGRVPDEIDPSSGAIEVAEVPADAGVFPTQHVYHRARDQESHALLQIAAFPVMYDPALDQARLYRSLTVRVVYRPTDPLALLRYVVPVRGFSLGEALTARFQALNATEHATTTIPVLAFVDADQRVARRVRGAAWELPAGSVRASALTATVPITPGQYSAVLTLIGGSGVLGRAAKPIFVAPAGVTEWSAVPSVHSGQAAELSVRLEQHTDRSMDLVLATRISGPTGRPADHVGPVTVTLPVGEPAEMHFVWDVPRDTPVGEYRAMLHGGSGGHRIAPESLRINVLPPIELYLPVLKAKD